MSAPEPRISAPGELPPEAPEIIQCAPVRSQMAPVSVTYSPRTKQWRLVGHQAIEDKKRGRKIVIPDGFSFDLASVPRALWSLIAPFELSILAPLVHDFLYRGNDERYSRAEADDLFRALMEREGVPWWRRWAAYAAVVRYGAEFWRGR